MEYKLRDEWLQDPTLRKWRNSNCTENSKCSCTDDKHHTELWEHDSCTRGRIDTTVCGKCDSIVTFKIIT